MERLWAPWRMDYICKENFNCFLCDKGKAENEQEDFILFRNEQVIVLLNIYPYNNGHLLIAPIRHIAEPGQMFPEEVTEFWRITNDSLQALKAALKPDGFNIGANLGKVAGAGLESHFHLHIVPRWQGDTNFMPLLAEVKVMPEHLSNTYLKLKAYFPR